MTVDSTPRLVGNELRELLHLAREADSIELKLTVPELAYRSTAAALGVDPLDAQIRQVFFFDTPDLTLNEAGLVARARRIQGKDSDSVVKLRPVVPSELPSSVRKSAELRRRDRRHARWLRVLGLDEGQPLADRRAGVGLGRQAAAPAVLQGAAGVLRRPCTRGTHDRRPVGARTDLRAQVEGQAGHLLAGDSPSRCGCTRTARESSSCRRSACPAEALDVADEARTFLGVQGHRSRRAISRRRRRRRCRSSRRSCKPSSGDRQGDLGAPLEIQKRKWDGTVSSVGEGRLVAAPAPRRRVVRRRRLAATAPQQVDVRTRRQPRTVGRDARRMVGACAPRGQALAMCRAYVLHAATPFERPAADLISWIDLDLDFEVADGVVALEDEAEFHAHASTMSYPHDVVRGAWSGISQIAPRYTTGEWPFDGWMARQLAAAVAATR